MFAVDMAERFSLTHSFENEPHNCKNCEIRLLVTRGVVLFMMHAFDILNRLSVTHDTHILVAKAAFLLDVRRAAKKCKKNGRGD